MSSAQFGGTFVTMATMECLPELALFLASLRAFHPTDPVIIGSTSAVIDKISTTASKHTETERLLADVLKGDRNVRWIPCLDQYGPINRRNMERQPGVWFGTRHTDFMMEKANLLEFALLHNRSGALFLDCDITFVDRHLGFSRDVEVCLSPHAIKPADEMLFGKYNGGYVWAQHAGVLHAWRKATLQSRYFDQASLEDVAAEFKPKLSLAPLSVNYGYWRMFQSPEGFHREVCKFRVSKGAIFYGEERLQSVHTHFHGYQNSRNIRLFNRLMLRWIADAGSLSPQWDYVLRALRLQTITTT